MINRLNVIWQGKRTTARFPDYLFDISFFASSFEDPDIFILSLKQRIDLMSTNPDYLNSSASQAVIDCLLSYIYLELTPAASGSNSRAPVSVITPNDSAAEA